MAPSLPHQVVCFGETLWDILPDNFLPGGAPMNVAFHLKKLGLNPALITRIGADIQGNKLVGLLRENGISTEYIQVDDKYSTGKVYAQPNDRDEVTYDIVNPSAWDFITWEERFDGLLAQAEYFVYGSLSARNPVSGDTLYRLLEGAKTKVLDINLRPPYFERSQAEHLLQKADILKMNSSEFELISGWYHYHQQPEDNMRLLQDRFHIEKVIVSMAGEGALLLDKGVVIRHPGYQVPVDDTIGCGDAFMAGLLYGFINRVDSADALSYANALGALIATYPGACPDYDTEELAAFIDSYGQKA